jgi:short-subunit dehydrogenase
MYIGMTEAYSVAQAAEQMDTNYFGAIRAMQAVLPSMRAAGRGLIINTSSLAGRVSVPFFGTYCATKHALEAYSQSLRYEVSPFGIDVALVEPGPFPSNLLAAGKPPARADVLASYGDLGQVPSPWSRGLPRCWPAMKPPTRNWSSMPICRWPMPHPASAPRARSSASPGAWTR